VTIAALRSLLDQAQPEVPRLPAPRLPSRKETPPVDTKAPDPAAEAGSPQEAAEPSNQLQKLLSWGRGHADPQVRDHAEQVAASLTALRERHRVDNELATIAIEEAELAERLEALRSRRDQLQPPAKSVKKPRSAPAYDAPAVRAWAAASGLQCPAVGRVPKHVLDAWQQHQDQQQPLQLAS